MPGLSPGRAYYYAFDADGETSPSAAPRRFPRNRSRACGWPSVSCSNYPAGYFNVYRCLANRPDLDAVLHLGDYIYEFANGVYGDGVGLRPHPACRPGEATTLADYRLRYATYRSDVDLQAAHAAHPFIVVWDDHEIVNDAWRGGRARRTRAAKPIGGRGSACRLSGLPRVDAGSRVDRAGHPAVPRLPVRPTGGSADARHARPARSTGRATRRRRARRPGPHPARRGAGGVALRNLAAITAGGHRMAAARAADAVRAADADRHGAAEHRRVGRLPGGAGARDGLPGRASASRTWRS